MAEARVIRSTTDETIEVSVSTELEHPDALDQMTARARMLFREVMVDMEPDEAESETD